MPYNPRHFLTIGCLLLILLPRVTRADTVPPGNMPLGNVPQAVPDRTRESEIRGIWIHTYGPYDWDAVMKKIAAAGFNCVFVRVARGMNAIYPSQHLPLEGWVAAAGGDEFQRALDAAHRHGLEFHAWKVCFNSNAATRTGPGPQAFYDKMVAEDRLSRDPSGKQATFLNPGDPRNEELEFNTMLELATKYKVDGVHFDYIRYTETPSYDFDYGEVSRREFEKATGKAVIDWPADVYSGPRKMEYEDWERENINRLVQRVYQAVKKAKPQVQVSAAVWRKHRLYRAALKQDWLHWVQQGWLDFVVPMDYTADHQDFRETIRSQVANTTGKIPIAAGIANYMQKTPDDLLKQIEIARQEGTDGYVLFAYTTEGMDAVLDALSKGPQAVPAYPAYRAPHLEWRLSPNFSPSRAEARLLGGVLRKDLVPAYEVGTPVRVSADASLNPTDAMAFIGLIGEATLEDFNSTPLKKLNSFNVGMYSSRRPWIQLSFPAPAGYSRIVLRGLMRLNNGETQPFVVRGPIIEGLSPAQIAELRAQELPPQPIGAGRRIAVYTGGQAQVGLLKMLQGVPGLNVYPLYRLRPEHWKTAQVLVLPQLNDVAEITPAVIEQLRAWVQAGGVLLLTHDAVGYRWHPRLFPEVGRGVGALRQQQIMVAPNQWGLTPGTLGHAFPTHVKLQPAPGATVLAREADAGQGTGDAVLIAGRRGRGVVIMYGSLLGYMVDGTIAEAERRLLVELVNIK